MRRALTDSPTTLHAYETDPYVRMTLHMIDRLVREVDSECARQGVLEDARNAVVARVVECAVPPEHAHAERARIADMARRLPVLVPDELRGLIPGGDSAHRP